ncbi:MAG: L-threonylcarbamoyladenylate synthase [Methermicoccaceae archaeon]
MAVHGDIARAVDVLRRGGVVAYPTETVYGLGAILKREAVRRVFALKKRSPAKPISIAVCSLDMMAVYAHLTSEALELIRQLAPGPYTFVLAAKPTLPPELVGADGSVGVRLPSDPMALELIERLGEAITSTSANLSGMAPPTHWSDVRLDVDFLLKGVCRLGEPSTVIDTSKLRILRRGAGASTAEQVLSDISP